VERAGVLKVGGAERGAGEGDLFGSFNGGADELFQFQFQSQQ
jgi:hypothetical protein